MSFQKMLCTLGRFDIPIIQLQPPFVVDLLDANIAVFGTTMSGKTTLIKAMVNMLHKQYDEKQEQIFILDFGGALTEYKEMPLVSAYFDNSNEEYVKRVFKILDNILKENIRCLGSRSYRDAGEQPIHTTFIIDNVNAFLDEPRYMAYQEKLAKLCRDGLSKGITIVITAANTKGISPLLGSFKQKIALEMPQEKYLEIFSDKVGMIENNPGHGFANVTVKPEGVTGTFRMNLPYEVQCVFPYKEEDVAGGDSQESFLEKLKSKYGYSDDKYVRSVAKHQTFPKELTDVEYKKLRKGAENIEENLISVGLDYVDFYPVGINFEKSHVIAIYGKKEFGKTNLLKLLLRGMVKQKENIRFVFLDDGRNQLKEIAAEIGKVTDTVLFHEYKEVELWFNDGTSKTKKLSPIQQFYVYLNEQCFGLDKKFMAGSYGVNKELIKEYGRIPDCKEDCPPCTVFVIQSKLVYLNVPENKPFITGILPQMVSVAEEKGFYFIFSDVQKMGELDQNSYFNNAITTAFLLDNIAEFAGERGQKTVFGSMDVKALKEDYARCEVGDGYFYDVESDNLLKLKYMKA